MTATKYAKKDIEAAANAVLTGHITEADITTLVASVFAANKAGTDILVAFKAAFAGGNPPADWATAFINAANAAKAKREADNKAKSTGGTPPPDPEAEKKRKLEEAENGARTMRNAIKTLSDEAIAKADAAENDADIANEAATEAEKLRSRSNEAVAARKASQEAGDAAIATRQASDDLLGQFRGADASLLHIEGIVIRKDDPALTETHADAIKAAHRAATRFHEVAVDKSAEAKVRRERAEKEREKLRPPVEPPEPVGWRRLIPAIRAIGVAIIAIVIANGYGVPGIIITGAVIGLVIVGLYVAFAPPEIGLRAALGFMVVMLLVSSMAFVFRDGLGDTGSNDQPEVTPTENPPVGVIIVGATFPPHETPTATEPSE